MTPDVIYKQERVKYNRYEQLPEKMRDEIKARMDAFGRNEIKLFYMPRHNNHRMQVERVVTVNGSEAKVLTSYDRPIGNIRLQSRWIVTLEIEGEIYNFPFGFISKTTPDGKPTWSPPTVKGDGTFELQGSNPEHREIYKALLVFPFFKNSIFSKEYIEQMGIRQTIEEINYNQQTQNAINEVDRVLARASFLDKLATQQLDILKRKFGVDSHEKVINNVKAYIKHYTDAEWDNFLSELAIATFTEAYELAAGAFISIEGNVVTTKTGKTFTIPMDFNNITNIKDRITAWATNAQAGKEFRTQIINEYLSGQYSTKKAK